MDTEIDENEITNLIQDTPEILNELDEILKNILNTEPSSPNQRGVSPFHKKRWKFFQRLVKLDNRHSDVYFQWPRDTRSSVAWSIKLYRVLFYKNRKQNFVMCKKCKNLLTHKTQIGVTNLLKHKCYGETLKQLLYDENILNMSFVLPSNIYPNDKQMINQLKDFRFVRQNGILTNFVYCIRCSDIFFAQRSPQFNLVAEGHSKNHLLLTPLSILSEPHKFKEKLTLLIRLADKSIKLYLIEKSSDHNCVWYFNIFRLIEYAGKIQSHLYCINCASLISYDLNEEENGGKNNKTVREHKCVITIYRDTDFEKTETVIDSENQLTFEIKILDEENDNGDENDETLVPNNGNKVPKLLKITLPPILLDEQFLINNLTIPKESSKEQSCKQVPVPVIKKKKSTTITVAKPLSLSSSTNTTVVYSQKTRSLLYLKFIAKNYLPIELIKTKSFIRLAQSIIRAGKLFGDFRIEQYWLSLKTVNLNLKNHMVQVKNQLSTKFLYEKLSYSCDIWENFHKKTLNITLRSHFVDKSFNLRTIVLGTKTINYRNYRNNTNNNWLIDYSVDILYDCLIQIPISVRRDRAKEILLSCCGFVSMHKCPKKSPLAYNTLKCAATSLNEIINNILYFESNEVIKIGKNILIVLSKRSLSLVSSSALSTVTLKREIKNCNLNDWKSLLNILLLYEDLKLTGDNEQYQNVKALISILRPVKLAIQCLGNIESKIPTINMVCVVKHKLINDLEALKGKCKIFELVRAQLHVSILHGFPIIDLHKVAAFLDPRFKIMKFLSEKERLRILDLVKKIMTCHEDNIVNYMDSYTFTIENKQIVREINHYFHMISTITHIPNQDSQNKNVVLTFWNEHRELPKLGALAKTILSIPASANVQACKFSPEANELIEKRSLQMSNEVDIDMIDVVNGNFHLVEFQ